MANWSAWGRAVEALLADGEWHPVEDVLAAGIRVVPPGVAYRAGESDRTRKGAGARTKGGAETSVASGARGLVRRVLAEQVRRGTVERRGDMVRRAPR